MSRALLGLALSSYTTQLTACAPEPGSITARWSFLELGTETPLQCPLGHDTTEVHVIPVDSQGNRNGSPIIDRYRCDDFTGTAEYEPQMYEIFMAITTPAGQAYATTPSAIVDITARDATVTQTVLEDGGYFRASWSLRGEVSGRALDCDDADARGIDLVVTYNATGQMTSTKLPCEQGIGYSQGLLEGLYTISIAALDGSDRSIGAGPITVNAQISGPNQVTDLDLVMIPITGL